MRRVVVALLVVAALPAAALAQTGTQITISQPAEATTMDPGRSTQVLTVNYFYKVRPGYRLIVAEMTVVK
jgi:hypothetical protein